MIFRISKSDYESLKSKVNDTIIKYSLQTKVKNMKENDLSNRSLWDLFWYTGFIQKDYSDSQIISAMRRIIKEIKI